MICQNCSHWKCQKLTYEELLRVWYDHIGDKITPGYRKRYLKQATLHGIPLEEVKIGFKYCSAGFSRRLYLMKNESDCKPNQTIKECPSFTSVNQGQEVKKFSTLWQQCISDLHGITEVKGVTFAPGLYENNSYMRIPYYEEIRPKIEKSKTKCAVCDKKTHKSIVIHLRKTFCCNKHYLEWWALRHREEYKRLSK